MHSQLQKKNSAHTNDSAKVDILLIEKGSILLLKKTCRCILEEIQFFDQIQCSSSCIKIGIIDLIWERKKEKIRVPIDAWHLCFPNVYSTVPRRTHAFESLHKISIISIDLLHEFGAFSLDSKCVASVPIEWLCTGASLQFDALFYTCIWHM